MSYRSKTLWLIASFSFIRCFVACNTELGNDEVYYRIFASDLQWNYFDHPPMVAWLIRLTTFNLYLDFEFFIRLGAILSAGFSTWLMYLCGKKLKDPYTGFLSAAIFSASLYFSVIAGIFILPDSPQMIFWTSGIYMLLHITVTRSDSRKYKNYLLLFGVICGFGMMCKIHTIFLWAGLILYILIFNRKCFRQPVLYVSAAITLLFFTPVILWNVQNDFITFIYHGDRVNITGSGFNLQNFLTFSAGQIFYINPFIFISITIALIITLKRKVGYSIRHKRILLLTSLPMIGLAFFISFFKPVLPHWSGPGFVGLILITALYFTGKSTYPGRLKRVIPFSILLGLVFQLIILIAGVLVINFYPGTIGNSSKEKLGSGDFTLDMYGWKSFSRHFNSIYNKENLPDDQSIIVTNKWFPAAHLDFYVARPLNIKVFVSGDISDIHQYQWMNKKVNPNNDSCTIYVISPTNYALNPDDIPFLKGLSPIKIDTIVQERSNYKCRDFLIYHFRKGQYRLH